jgi:hypothetical protein
MSVSTSRLESLDTEPRTLTIQILAITSAGDELMGEVVVQVNDPASTTQAKMKAVIVADPSQFVVSQVATGHQVPLDWEMAAELKLPMPNRAGGVLEGQPAKTVTLSVRGPGGIQPDPGGQGGRPEDVTKQRQTPRRPPQVQGRPSIVPFS